MDSSENISNTQNTQNEQNIQTTQNSFIPKQPYNEDSFINAFGFKYSLRDYENWEKNRIYNVSKEIQYKAIINTINTSLPQYILYYYFQNLGFKCEYDLKANVVQNSQKNEEKPLAYVLDLYDPVNRIDIEYDGKEYHKKPIKDIERDNRVLTEPTLDSPIARKVIRIREGGLLYNGKNNYVDEYKINQYNQGFNEGYAKVVQDIYDSLIKNYGPFENHYTPLKIDPVANEATIRLSYFEYAEKLITEKGEQIFDYYPFKNICQLYINANKEIPQYIIQRHREYTIRTAYKYDTRFLIDTINTEYQKDDNFYSMLKKLENKYDTLKRAELCDANRITIQNAISLVLFCHRYNNRQLISDLLSAKIDNKAARILILSDTYMQLLFAKKYEGVNTPFYEDTRYKLMNYRRNEDGQICPDANVILFHRIKYEEEEWALWHELQSFANEFKISPLEAMFKKIMISNDATKVKDLSLKYYDHFLGISQNNKLSALKTKKNIETQDILTVLYENKAEIAEFMKARTDLYRDVYENKTEDEIYDKLKDCFLKEKNDDRYKRKQEVNQNLSFASAFGISSLDTLFKTAKDSDDLNKILNSYGVRVSPFKTALAHDFIMKKDYNLETQQFTAILKKNPSLFPDMKDLSLPEIYKKIRPTLEDNKSWSHLVHPFFTNTQEKKISENMEKISAFKKMKDEKRKEKNSYNKFSYKNHKKSNASKENNKEFQSDNYSNYSKSPKYSKFSKGSENSKNQKNYDSSNYKKYNTDDYTNYKKTNEKNDDKNSNYAERRKRPARPKSTISNNHESSVQTIQNNNSSNLIAQPDMERGDR